VEFIKTGDIVSVPFNVACGRCRNCMEMCPNLCMNVNPIQPGGAYGYVMMGGWPGGQAEYVLVPYADFNLLPIPNKSAALDNLLDLAYITDILPTGFHGAVTAGVGCGDNVYIAGAGPVGLAAAACCTQLLGAGAVIVSDYEEGRLKQAKAMGCETILLKSEWTKGVTGFVRSTLLGQDQLSESIEKLLGEKYVDCAIDCTGFETNGHHGRQRHTNPERAEALNDIINTVRPGGGVGIPAVYMPMDPGAEDSFGKKGGLTLEYGTAWNKGLSIANGQCPVKRYNRRLMNAILNGRLHLAEYLNTTIISLDEAPRAYKEFDEGVARKFVIDPHNMISSRAKANAKAKTFQDKI
jgi:glutathione-independent formaldehyde dehydrogenase